MTVPLCHRNSQSSSGIAPSDADNAPTPKKLATLSPFPIDRSKCSRSISLPALLINTSFCEMVLKTLKQGELFYHPKFPPITAPPVPVDAGEGNPKNKRLVLLDPKVCADLMPPFQKKEDALENAESITPELKKLIQVAKARIVQHTLLLTYDHFNVDQALALLLPPDVEPPSSFETIGHIAHLNLRDHLLPHRHLIGQVLIDKHKHIRTVVHKTSNIHHTFRFFEMEVIAGDLDTMVEMRESGCVFEFDYTKVYWNSRLSGEHGRITQMLTAPTPTLVCDVFGGVGPFAIPAGKKGCIVLANDLNPASFEYLSANVGKNRLEHRVIPHNLDGRDFIRQSLVELNIPTLWDRLRTAEKGIQEARIKSASRTKRRKMNNDQTVALVKESWYPDATIRFYAFDHYVMNLPDIALEFLDAFKGLYRGQEDHFPVTRAMPMIHVHCFARELDLEKEVLDRAAASLGYALDKKRDEVQIVNVRDVAPNKWMMCLSFRLPRAVAFES